ncbi:MAG: hypothetical protein U0V70_15075 [Terriglobia bacterium]
MNGEIPVPFKPEHFTADQLTRYLFLYAYSRQPVEKELQLSKGMLLPVIGTKISVDGVEDLLWGCY